MILADATTATAPAAAIATTTADIAAAFCLIVVCPHHYLCLRRLCLSPPEFATHHDHRYCCRVLVDCCMSIVLYITVEEDLTAVGG